MKRIVRAGLAALLLLSCRKSAPRSPVERTGFFMDTVVHVSILDREADEARIDRAIDRAFGTVKAFESMQSGHVDTSDVSRITRSAGGQAVQVRPETIDVLKLAEAVSERSEGAFDVTIRPLKDLWPFDSENPAVPSPKTLRAVLPHIDYRQIVVRGDSVLLAKPGMGIDLGGIAKGYIVDRAVESLQRDGLRSGIVEAGGDLRIFGQHPENKSWRIGVRHPRSEQSGLAAVLSTPAASIATSGDYERYFMQDGKRYHHILDPKTGFPASGCISVTVVAPLAVLADAYATAVFVLGPEKGSALIGKMPGMECLIFYEKNGRLEHMLSAGLVSKVEFIE